ncbi:MAG: hypothetical protein PWQ70_3288 [Clostridiales bacterium]|nr:hypothetical protein [Clostridiales bacterium]
MQSLWDVVSSIGTVGAAFFAAISTVMAKKAISISSSALNDQMRPVLLFSNLKTNQLRTNEKESLYCVDLNFCNHGKSVALVREIESQNENFAAHLSIPIGVGPGDETCITLFFSKRRLDEINGKFINSDVGCYKDQEWDVEVTKAYSATFAEEQFNVIKISRQLKLHIYYWSITGKCFRNEINKVLTITNKIHMFVDCYVVSEKTDELFNKRNIPSSIKQHDNIMNI